MPCILIIIVSAVPIGIFRIIVPHVAWVSMCFLLRLNFTKAVRRIGLYTRAHSALRSHARLLVYLTISSDGRSQEGELLARFDLHRIRLCLGAVSR